MFKKNQNRPQITINLKKVNSGYKVVPNEMINPFSFKRITRAIFRADLYNSNPQQDNSMGGMGTNSAMIQPPHHITIPHFSRWFDLDKIHEIQQEAFPEFFSETEEEGKLFKKTPRLYMFYRNFVITLWRENSKKYLSPTVCRRNLPGDVSCIIRIHAFLEHWGLINFPSKQHTRGYLEAKPNPYYCDICEVTKASEYFIAELEPQVILQICDCCYCAQLYPSELSKSDFRKIIVKVHEKSRKGKKMKEDEILKMLEIISSEGSREKQVWVSLAKQFPDYTREEVMVNFLEIPANNPMNSNTFEANEDYMEDEQPPIDEVPTVFEDYENPQQAGIAMSYYLWKSDPEKYPYLQDVFNASIKHSQYLANQQKRKSKQVLRMLIDVHQSKFELKSVFLQQFKKLVKAEQISNKKVCANLIAETLKNQMTE